MIHGTLITLRPIAPGDLDHLEAWENDPAYDGEFNTFGLQPSGHLQRAYAQSGLLDDNHGLLMVETKVGEPAGTVSFRLVLHGPPPASRAYQLGITIAPAHRGKGYGTEAQQLIAAYLFATYPIARVEAETDVTNAAEQHALDRAGFTREGILRRAQWRAGAWHDLALYSKLRDE
jgi:RimJ/RimL family protein N-acetyltransferase